MTDSGVTRKLTGGVGILLGLGVAAWGLFGASGQGGDWVPPGVLWLFLAAILVVTGVVTVCTRREDFRQRPGLVTCARCESQRRREDGFACSHCGSRRLFAPRFNRVVLTLTALFFAVPPVGFLGHLAVLWLQEREELDALLENTEGILAIIACFLFAAISCAYAAAMGQSAGVPPFRHAHMRNELEFALHSRAYAISLMLLSFVVMAGLTVVYVSAMNAP